MIRSGAVRFHDALEPFLRPIADATPHPENNNEGDLDAIDHSVESNGMYKPVLVQQSTGYILAGNHTWMTVKDRGADVCPMLFLDVDDVTAKRIMLDDNHTSRLGKADPVQTLRLLEELADAGELPNTTYTSHDLAVLEELEKVPLEYEHASWPTFTVALHPRTLKAFYYITREADNDRDRFEVLLRLAGWDGT